MNEITQLREHIDRRCSSLDDKMDDVLTAIRGDGVNVEGLNARTTKNAHDINGFKLTVPALGDRVGKVEKETSDLLPLKVEVPTLNQRLTKVEHATVDFTEYLKERKDDRKWRNRLIISAIVAVCGSTATSIALAVKASANHEEKASGK